MKKSISTMNQCLNQRHISQRTQQSTFFSIALLFAFCALFALSALSLAHSAFAADSTTSTGSDQLSLLSVTFISQTPDPVEPGSYVDLRWQVTNNGGKSGDYTFELQPKFPFSLDNPGDALVTSASISSYQTTDNGAILYYRVRVADTAIEGNGSSIKLIYYKTGQPNISTEIDQAGRIESKQGLVNIDNVTVSPSQVGIGSIFNVSLDVENFGSNFISNVMVSLGTENSGLVPFGSSNQKSVSLVPGKSTATFTFPYFVDSSATINVVPVPVSVTYYDSLGRLNSVNTTIGVQIGANPSFFPNLDLTDVFMADSQGKIVVSVSNTGKSDINFAVLELLDTNDYDVVGPTTSYLGNLKSDDLQTGQFNIYVKPTNATSIPLQFKLTYKDAYDQNVVQEFTLQNRLYDKALAQKLGLLPATSHTGAVIIVVIILAIGGYWWYRRSKKKAAAEKMNSSKRAA